VAQVIDTIAVVGSGISGIVASILLQERYKVTLFEKNDYVGGHTNTIPVTEGGGSFGVDTGFIVFNDRTYPNFSRFLARLGVDAQDSDMSFSYYDPFRRVMYSSDMPGGLFADRRNIFRPSFYRMAMDIGRFNASARRDFRAGVLAGITLGEYLRRGAYGSAFIDNYFLPMAAAIWSAPTGKVMDFPCETFIRFYENHGILDLGHGVRWKTVSGGSNAYVRAFLKSFKGSVRMSSAVTGIERGDGKVFLTLADGSVESADAVVVATHADQALALLRDPTPDEKGLLGAWTYSKNHTALHTDAGRMPASRRAWVSWNYIQTGGADRRSPVSLTYYMNRLQRLRAGREYFVSLNQSDLTRKDAVIYETVYEHPQYDFASMKTQPLLPGLNGRRNTYFCGSYFGYGFHEDGARSAAAACDLLGASL